MSQFDLFEASDISRDAMLIKLKRLLNNFDFTQKIVSYVKSKTSNFQTYVNNS
jgi:hypothetical protein